MDGDTTTQNQGALTLLSLCPDEWKTSSGWPCDILECVKCFCPQRAYPKLAMLWGTDPGPCRPPN